MEAVLFIIFIMMFGAIVDSLPKKNKARWGIIIRYELEPKEKRTGNAILYEDLNTPDITKNKAYLVVGHDGKLDSVKDFIDKFKKKIGWWKTNYSRLYSVRTN